jgi:type III restriction enzyme
MIRAALGNLEAADFYLNTLRPDFTLLATATPNDEKLKAFEAAAGVAVDTRVVVDRKQVVAAALNKRGLMLGLIRFAEGEARLIDPEQAALAAGWDQHQRIKARLAERGLAVTPLMLVQVEDKAASGPDPVARVKARLIDAGVPESVIAIHTSGQPDPDFHMLAYDDSREVLVFKVAVATGFDAPRAWTLVSVRPNRTTAFGLQIVGRIMRVHPAVRPIAGDDRLLDRGYVFLTDADLQTGLTTAADEMKAVRGSIEAISDELTVAEFSNVSPILNDAAHRSLKVTAPPKTELEREQRLIALEDAGFLDAATVRSKPPEEQDRVIVTAEYRQSLASTPMFGDLPESVAPRPPAKAPHAAFRAYEPRHDRGVPKSLLREVLPPPEAWNAEIIAETAKALFRQSQSPLTYLNRCNRRVELSLRDLFQDGEVERHDLNVRMSDARIAEAAQQAFDFNDQLDPRRFKSALIEEFRRRAVSEGFEFTEKSLRLALNFFALSRPQALKTALRTAQANAQLVTSAEPLPTLYVPQDEVVQTTRLGAYDVFPFDMNKPERAFAEWLDGDRSGRVQWWLRLKENTPWAVTIILPTGKRFYPDFAVGVDGRRTPDHIALIEIKDDGGTGRLHADENLIKIRSAHKEYKSVFWTVQDEGLWVNARLDDVHDRILRSTPCDVAGLVH